MRDSAILEANSRSDRHIGYSSSEEEFKKYLDYKEAVNRIYNRDLLARTCHQRFFACPALTPPSLTLGAQSQSFLRQG